MPSSQDPFDFADTRGPAPVPGAPDGPGRSPFSFESRPTAAPPRPGGPRRRRWPGWVGLGVVTTVGVVVAVLGFGIGGEPGPTPDRPAAADPAGSIAYEVTGAGPAASIEYSAPQAAGANALLDVPLPFRVTVPVSGVPSVYTVVVRTGPGGAPVTCRVVGAGTLDERTADGPFAAVTCSAPASP